MFISLVRNLVVRAAHVLNSTYHCSRLKYCFKKASCFATAWSLSLVSLFVCLFVFVFVFFCSAFYQLLLIMSYHHLFLVTTGNTNWQKMHHLGSPANKRCVILRAGMVANDTKKQIFFNWVSTLAYFFLKHYCWESGEDSLQREIDLY